MPSKKIERDERGHPIVQGSKTFGSMVKPRGGRYQSRTIHLKSQASSRLAFLMKKGADKFSKDHAPISSKEREALEFQNELARQNEIVRFAYFRDKLNEMEAELKELLGSGNQRKIQLLEPTLRATIAETMDILRELMSIIRNKK